MVNVVPYAASAAWYAAWLRSLSSDCPMEEAIADANISTQTDGKDFARTRIRGNAPGDEILLSVAVVGGASILKQSRRLSHAILSEHSDWQHNHLGALEASYGRAPFFRYIFPDLKRIFSGYGQPLADFNREIHNYICDFLNIRDILSVPLSDAAKERGKELACEISPRLSIIDPLMRFGPETILILRTL